MDENNKVNNSEIQVIEDDTSEEKASPNNHIEYINDLLGKESKLSAYSLLAIGILALVAIIVCLFIAF